MFICISGIDGSGKTTQYELLQDRLSDSDQTVKYTWCGLKPHISKPLFRIGERLFYSGSDSVEENHSTKTELLEDWKIKQIYRSIIIPDYLSHTSLSTRYYLRRYDVVLSDRYIHDAAIDLSILFGNEDSVTDRYNSYKNLVPDPTTILLIDVSEETAFERKNDIPSIDYLTKRRELYEKMWEEEDLIKIDGERSLDEVNECIIGHLKDQGLEI